MMKRGISFLLATIMVLGMLPLNLLSFGVSAEGASGTDGTVFAPYGSPTIDGTLDVDATYEAQGITTWLLNGKLGDIPFGARWDSDNLYLALQTTDITGLTINGKTIGQITGAASMVATAAEIEVPLDALGIDVIDYNTSAPLALVLGTKTFNGTVTFEKNEAQFFDMYTPDPAGAQSCANGTGTRSEDLSTFTFGVSPKEPNTVHNGWVKHVVYSQKAITKGIPTITDGAVSSDDTHVIEFNFIPTKMPVESVATQTWLLNNRDYHVVNGFNFNMKYDASLTASANANDGGSGHAYTAGIVNIDGALTLAIRTVSSAATVGNTVLYTIAAAGTWTATDAIRIRLAYDFSTGLLTSYANGKLLGSVDPLVATFTSAATTNLLRMELIELSHPGLSVGGDCKDIQFSVSDMRFGMAENDSVLTSELLGGLSFEGFKGTNTAADAIFSDLSLPVAVSNAVFGDYALTWESSDPTVISNSGVVTLPTTAKTVTMTVKLAAKPEVAKSFELTVVPQDATAMEQAFYKDAVTVDGNLNDGWVRYTNITGASGTRKAALLWDMDNLYVAVKALAADETINLRLGNHDFVITGTGVTELDSAVSGATVIKNGSTWEVKIPLIAAGIALSDYNQTATYKLSFTDAMWEGKLQFAASGAQQLLPNAHLDAATGCGVGLSGSRSEDKTSISFMMDNTTCNTSSHGGWIAHSLTSYNANNFTMPKLTADNKLAETGTHVLEFDFKADNMQEYTSWWNAALTNVMLCNGFVGLVQFEKNVTTDGHSYVFGITNLNGELTLCVRSTDNGNKGLAIGLGKSNGDSVHLRFEYELTTKKLAIYADGDHLTTVEAIAAKWGGDGRIIAFQLQENGSTATTGKVEFTLSNIYSGLNKNSVYSSEILDAIKEEDFLGMNPSKDAVEENLILPEQIEHPVFGDLGLTWESSDPSSITNDGVVTTAATAKTVTLTVKLTAKPEVYKTFQLTVVEGIKQAAQQAFYNNNVSVDGVLNESWNRYFQASGVSGKRYIAAMWDKDNLYLAVKAQAADTQIDLTVNGHAFVVAAAGVSKGGSLVAGADVEVKNDVWEIQIPFTAFEKQLTDYNQSVTLKMYFTDAKWYSDLVFVESGAQLMEPNTPTASANCGAALSGSRSEDKTSISFKMDNTDCNVSSHNGWIAHSVTSYHANHSSMPQLNADNTLAETGIHVLEFDFTADNMQEYATWWDAALTYSMLCNGFVGVVQFEKNVTTAGHSYNFGITNLNGELTLCIRSTDNGGKGVAIGLGKSNGDSAHLRFEYDLTTKMLTVYVDGEYLTTVEAVAVRWGNDGRVIALQLQENGSTATTGKVEFTVSNIYAGMNKASVNTSQTLNALEITDILGSNASEDKVTSNLVLPGFVNNEIFGNIPITWESSDTAVISNTGVVVRGDVDKEVTLTVKLANNPEVSKTFTVTVVNTSVLADYQQAFYNTKVSVDGKLTDGYRRYKDITGGGTFAAQWDNKTLYLAIRPLEGTSVMQLTVNDVVMIVDSTAETVTGVDGAKVKVGETGWEIAIPFAAVNASLQDYNQAIPVKLVSAETNWEGGILVVDEVVSSVVMAQPVVTEGAGYCAGAGSEGGFSSNGNKLTFKLGHKGVDHTGSTKYHRISSTKNAPDGMPALDDNNKVVSSAYIHSLEFDFAATNMPAESDWNSQPGDLYPANGMVTVVQFDVKNDTTPVQDGYCLAITNLNGEMCIVVRTALNKEGKYGTVFSLKDLGVNPGDTFRVRFEYKFEDKSLSIWVNDLYVGTTNPQALQWAGAHKVFAFSLVSIKNAGPDYSMEFSVSNVESANYRSSVNSAAVFELLDENKMLNKNSSFIHIQSDLKLPDKLTHPLFGDVPIVWTSSDPDVVENSGKVHIGKETKTVTLTAAVAANPSETKDYELIVSKKVLPALFAGYYEGLVVDGRMDYQLILDAAVGSDEGARRVSAKWDGKNIYLLVEKKSGDSSISITLNGITAVVTTGGVTVNGKAVSGAECKLDAVWEIKIPRSTFKVTLTEYNQSTTMTLKAGKTNWNGQMIFEDTAFETQNMLETVVGDKNASVSAIDNGKRYLITHEKNNTKEYSNFGRVFNVPSIVATDKIHVTQFDFKANSLPNQTEIRNYHYVAEGMTLALQFGEHFVGEEGHGYTAAIIKYNGKLCLVVRANTGENKAILMYLDREEGELFHLRLEYNFDNKDLTIWLDDAYMGVVNPMMTAWSSSTPQCMLIGVYANGANKESTGVDFEVTNVQSGIKQETVYSVDTLRFLKEEYLLGTNNFDTDVIFSNLKLPSVVTHPAFGSYKIKWKTSNANVITASGKVTVSSKSKKVTLTAEMVDVPGATKKFPMTVCKNTISLNALAVDEIIKLDATLEEYTWSQWTDFVTRTEKEPTGTLSIAWDKEYIYFALLSDDATSLELNIDSVSVKVDLAKGTVTGVNGGKAIKKGRIAEIAIPMSEMPFSLYDYDQSVTFTAKLRNSTGAAVLPCGYLCFSGRVAQLENFTSYTKSPGWVSSGDFCTFTGMEDAKSHYMVRPEMHINWYKGMKEYEYEEFIENNKLDDNLSMTLMFEDLPVSSGNHYGMLAARGFYFWLSRNSYQNTKDGYSYGDVFTGVIYNMGDGWLGLNILKLDDNGVYGIYKHADLGLHLGETFRLEVFWGADESLRIYVNNKKVIDAEDATYFARGGGVECMTFRYMSEITERPQKVRFHVSRVVAVRGVYQTVANEMKDPYDTFPGLDLLRIREDLPMGDYFSTKYFAKVPVSWESSEPDVIDISGKVYRGEEDATTTISMFYEGELLWLKQLTVQSKHATDAASPNIYLADMNSGYLKIDGSVVNENWMMGNRTMKDGLISGYMGAKWDMSKLYIAIKHYGKAYTLKVNGVTIDPAKVNAVSSEELVELEIPMSDLGIQADYDVMIPVEVTVDGGIYEGQLKLSKTEWFVTDFEDDRMPTKDTNLATGGLNNAIPTEYQGVTMLPNGFHQFDVYSPLGSNPCRTRTWTLHRDFAEYNKFNDRTKSIVMSFDVQPLMMPVYTTENMWTDFEAFACYGICWAVGDKPNDAKYCNVITGGIVYTIDGLQLVVGGNALTVVPLKQKLGDLFRITMVWHPNGDLEMFVDEESVGYFEDRELFASGIITSGFCMNTLRNELYPNTEEDSIDVYFSNYAFGYAYSGKVIDTLNWDTIRKANKYEEGVKTDLNLVKELRYDPENVVEKVTWTSSDPDMINPETGKVTQPKYGAKVVTLTATLADGSTKSFEVIVIGYDRDPGNTMIKTYDLNPYDNAMVYDYFTDLYALDSNNNSIGVDLKKAKKINAVRLTDLDNYGRLNTGTMQLFVSKDNKSYTEIMNYKLLKQGDTWYFYDFEAEARYVKIHYTHLDNVDSNVKLALYNAVDAYWENVVGSGETAFTEKTIEYTNTTGKVLRDGMISISKSQNGITGNDSAIRLKQGDKYLYHYVDGDLIYIRIPDAQINEKLTLTVLYGATDARDMANKEAVYEITYGTRSSYVNNATQRNIFALRAGKYKLGTVKQERLISWSAYNVTTSLDGGKTWQNYGKLTSKAMEAIRSQADVGNGGWIFDSVTGRIMYETHRITFPGKSITESYDDTRGINVVLYSDDFGKTWELADEIEPMEVDPDPLVKDDEIDYHYSLSYSDGIQVSSYDGTGPNVDFVFPVSTAINAQFVCNAMVIYSCDGGLTWQWSENLLSYGGVTDVVEGGVSENWILENEDHALVLYARAQARNQINFAKFYSYDFGVTWTNRTREKWEELKNETEFSKTIKGIRSTVYTSNTQPLMYAYETSNGAKAPLFVWPGNNANGGVSYMRSPLNVAVSYDGLDTWRNIQNLYFGTYLEGFGSLYTHNTTNPSMTVTEEDRMIMMFLNSHYGIVNFSATDFENWLYRTKGAYDDFETGNPRYEGWLPVAGTVASSKDKVYDGEHSLKLSPSTTSTRSIPYLRAGKISFQLYMDANTQVSYELQPAFAEKPNYFNTADIEIKDFKMVCGETVVELKEGWNDIVIDLTYNLDNLHQTGYISANGSEPQRIRLDRDIADYVCYLTTFTTSVVYMDNFTVVSDLDAEIYTNETEHEAKAAKEAKVAEDKAAAKKIDNQINKIGEVTLDSADVIAKARAAYEALTEDQKDRVKNLDRLRAAEAKLLELKQEKAKQEEEERNKTMTIIIAVVAGVAAVGGATTGVLVGIKKKKAKMPSSDGETNTPDEQ